MPNTKQPEQNKSPAELRKNRILTMSSFLVKMLKDFESDKAVRTALIGVMKSWGEDTDKIYSEFSQPYAEELVNLIYEIINKYETK